MKLRIQHKNRGAPIQFYFDGEPVMAYEGETIAMALWAAGVYTLRLSPKLNEPRGVFCGMGVCQECVVWIDGQRRESCMTLVRADLSVSGVANAKP
jgi:aerobic-type carbon monoxide dehydrogenase small subunit (CoxS/CutS family)